MKNTKNTAYNQSYHFRINVNSVKDTDKKLIICKNELTNLLNCGRTITSTDIVFNLIKSTIIRCLVDVDLMREIEAQKLSKMLMLPLGTILDENKINKINKNIDLLIIKYYKKESKNQFINTIFELYQPLIKKVSFDLFLAKRYSESVEAACKEINYQLKCIYGLNSVGKLDGDSLITNMLSPQNPILKLTNNITESDKNIQKGYMFLLQGMWSAIRDPKAHENLIIQENDAIEILGFISALMKTIMNGKKYKKEEEE